MWVMQKEIKDAYPKKVCHMLKRHVRKKKIKKKDAYPKKVCHMPTRHVKKREKDSPHPLKIKKRDGSCKGVHPPSTKKNPTHLHILNRLYGSFLLGSSL